MALAAPIRRTGLPPSLIAVPVAAWGVAVLAELSGRAGAFHHDHLLGGGQSPWLGVPAFLVGWQLMVAAMMLPSAIPMLAAFRRVSACDERPDAARSAFLGAYLLVWTTFGLVAFAGDAALHRLVAAAPSVAARPWLIEGGVLVLAGLAQFTDLKHRCLTQCRTPIGFLAQRYRPGLRAAFAIGRSHGLFCVGCCWALMLLSFAVGLGSLVWMAELTALMVVERAVPGGDRVTAPAGFFLVALGALAFAHPSGLGSLLRIA